MGNVRFWFILQHGHLNNYDECDATVTIGL